MLKEFLQSSKPHHLRIKSDAGLFSLFEICFHVLEITQLYVYTETLKSELRRCVRVEVAVLGFPS